MSDFPPSTLSYPVVKRSVTLAGHTTSVSLEEPFWTELQTIAKEQGKSLSQLILEVDETERQNLSGALRLYVLFYWMNKRS